jgi:hypothetical protein
MYDLMSDISGLGQICLVWGSDMFDHQKLCTAKSRLRAKTMHLGLDELAIRS